MLYFMSSLLIFYKLHSVLFDLLKIFMYILVMIKWLILFPYYLYSAFIYLYLLTIFAINVVQMPGGTVDGIAVLIYLIIFPFVLALILFDLIILLFVIIYKAYRQKLDFQKFKNYFLEFGNNKVIVTLKIINFLIVFVTTIVLIFM